MAYQLKRGETVAEAVPRIAGKQVDKALEALAGDDPVEAVHDARTSIKRLRGLLRLVHPWLDREEKDTERLRALAHELGPLRDAEVLIQTFDGLWDREGGALPPSLRRVRARLVARLRGLVAELDLPTRLHQATRGFRKLDKRVRRWVPRHGRKNGGWAAVEAGLTETYAKGRRWFGQAGASNADHAFHQWRRYVKFHGYHLQLLAELWPEELATRGNELTRLGDLLGEDHDLSVFRTTLEAEPRSFDSAADRVRLFACITARQVVLRAEALPLGQRLYAEAPRRFRRRLQRYWQTWWSDWRSEAQGKKAKAAKLIEAIRKPDKDHTAQAGPSATKSVPPPAPPGPRLQTVH